MLPSMRTRLQPHDCAGRFAESVAAPRAGWGGLTSISARVAIGFLWALGSMAALAAANKVPTVSLTSPSNGATFAAPATVTLSATASDADGTISRVEFYDGTTLIGTRTSSPYTMTWSGVAGGTYSLTARAVDDRGGQKTSTAASITVTGAKVVIATPTPGATVYGGSTVVSGSFYGDSNTTVLVDNGNTTRAATLDGYTYTTTIPLHVGVNTLRVVASRRDRTSDQATVTVVGNGDPLLVFTAPAATVFEAPANVTLAIDASSPASSISKVEFYRNGSLLGTATSPPYQQAWTGVGAGTYTVSAVATDALGVKSGTSLAITVRGSNVPPAASLTSPAAGASFVAPASIPMAASVSDPDGTVSLVEFLHNGAVVASTNVQPYAVTLSNVAAGSHSLAARATDDRAAVTTSAPVNVTVLPPNNPPTVVLTSPSTGAAYAAPATIALAAAASDADGSIAKVEFLAGSTLVGTATTAPYGVTWSGVVPGTYPLTARATDNAGASTTSAAVTVTVRANQPPTVSLVAPSSGAAFQAPATINLTAAASDPDGSVAKVDFFAGATMIGTATSPPHGLAWTGVVAGTYTLTARATDNAGAVTTSAPVTVTVSAPALAISSPADGATIDGDHVTVSGIVQAPANSGVTVNGQIAAVDAAGHFYATGVPLALGANTIGVTLTTLAGATTTQSIGLTSTGPAPVRIVANPTQGISPLAVVFQVLPGDGVQIARVDIDGDGSGSVDQTLAGEPWTTSITYTGTGTVTANVRVTGSEGAVRTESIPIVLVDAAALDQSLRAVWSGMTTALAAGDKASAMRYLDTSAQQKYGPVFDTLLPNMPQIVGSFSAPRSMTIAEGIGEYAVNRTINGENRLFLIYFGRNGDGVWRLGSM
jgi:Bacterial Ig domain/Glucodextranase, domain B